jgi:hypothetical protein
MALAFDAKSEVSVVNQSDSFTHTPVGTPRGVMIFAVVNSDTAPLTTLTYGGVAMNLIDSATRTIGEAGSCHAYQFMSCLSLGYRYSNRSPNGCLYVYRWCSSSSFSNYCYGSKRHGYCGVTNPLRHR